MTYKRNGKIKQKLEDLLEHASIYEMVQQRKASPVKKISLEKIRMNSRNAKLNY